MHSLFVLRCTVMHASYKCVQNAQTIVYSSSFCHKTCYAFLVLSKFYTFFSVFYTFVKVFKLHFSLTCEHAVHFGNVPFIFPSQAPGYQSSAFSAAPSTTGCFLAGWLFCISAKFMDNIKILAGAHWRVWRH